MAGQYIDRLSPPASSRPFVRLPVPAAPRLPGLCAVCHDWGWQRVCAGCTARFLPAVTRCRRCALRVPAGVTVCGACLTHPPPYLGTVAAMDYDHPWDGLISRFKFHAALDLTRPLVERLLQAQHAAALPVPELLLPVPLSPERLRERGYNQAWELARRVAARLGCPVDPGLLLRVRHTPHQLALAPDRRAGNVRAAFAVDPLQRHRLQGRAVTLLDDVMTTGATAAEISRVLLQAGAREVRVWVIARTPRPGDG